MATGCKADDSVVTFSVAQDFHPLHPLQHDALREVANVATGHAATALSTMTGRRVMISVPRLTLPDVKDLTALLSNRDRPTVTVAMHVLGDIAGRFLFVVPSDDALRLCALLLGRPKPLTELDSIARSGLLETGNILGGSYLSALSTVTGKILMLSVPTIGSDELVGRGPDDNSALCLDTRFRIGDENQELQGYLLLVAAPASVRAILEAIRHA
ncbi:MAG TPA: chemotaxis protein CheC [Gemmatimonadales bacterium]|nr:chemotaxis protein CheC [Gemmatimonadales bacterium]